MPRNTQKDDRQVFPKTLEKFLKKFPGSAHRFQQFDFVDNTHNQCHRHGSRGMLGVSDDK